MVVCYEHTAGINLPQPNYQRETPDCRRCATRHRARPSPHQRFPERSPLIPARWLHRVRPERHKPEASELMNTLVNRDSWQSHKLFPITLRANRDVRSLGTTSVCSRPALFLANSRRGQGSRQDANMACKVCSAEASVAGRRAPSRLTKRTRSSVRI